MSSRLEAGFSVYSGLQFKRTMSSGQKRATVVQIKRRVHEAAAESVSIGPKRAKAAPDQPEAAAAAAEAAAAVAAAAATATAAAATAATAAAATATAAAATGERVVLRRLQSFSQRDIDQGEHLKLLVRPLCSCGGRARKMAGHWRSPRFHDLLHRGPPHAEQPLLPLSPPSPSPCLSLSLSRPRPDSGGCGRSSRRSMDCAA